MSSDLNQITESIIGCAYTVSNTLGHGFLSKSGYLTSRRPVRLSWRGFTRFCIILARPFGKGYKKQQHLECSETTKLRTKLTTKLTTKLRREEAFS